MLWPEVAQPSQTERLRESLAASAITHGQAVRADLSYVEVSRKVYPRELVFFCRMRGLRINETIVPGDGDPLPPAVVVRGLAVDTEGFYNIRNALIISNGRIEVIVDGESKVALAESS
ncbi:MAG: hypothetical protein HY560_04410 [Gemmatimonadetes bacterium]|nr:hypothetical protein [Gemmatimonadota bacterium]